MIRRLPVYAHTLRHLRPVQWVYLPLRRLQAGAGRVPAASSGVGIAAQAGLERAVARIGVDEPEGLIPRAERVVRREFHFLGQTEVLPEIDWRKRHVSHLWSYNLHYFDYARDLAWAYRASGENRYREAFQELALSWIRGTDPGRGDAWEPFTVSLRMVNWIYASLLFGEALAAEVRAEIAASLARQAAWLERRLEYHIQANHLQKNFYALAVAGLFFAGREARRWRSTGVRGSWSAIREQVLADGGHYERSPMYHAIALQDFLELIALCEAAGEPVPAAVRERVERMAEAFGVLCRPDGTPHLFNDAANGIASSREHLNRLAHQVLGRQTGNPTGLFTLPESGYFGVADPARGDRLIVACGEPSPRYQPGHAHCDLLSYELDLAGRPFAVDAGVHGYDGDPYRAYVRSTRAHNTVMIGGREQHEVWGTFRVARRGRVLQAKHEGNAAGYRFVGAYSPYYDSRAAHYRAIQREEPRWTVTDRVNGAAGAPLASFLHLHPEWQVAAEGGRWLARAGTAVVEIVPFGMDRVRMRRGETAPVQGWHCPAFGKALPAPVLEMSVDGNDGREFGYTIQLVRGHNG